MNMTLQKLWKVGGGALLVGAVGYFLLPQFNKGEIFIPGDQPVSSEQVRQKLQSDGWSNVQIKRQGPYFEAVATKDGREGKIWVNAENGRLRILDDDDNGEPDDNN
jgi:hypothetical protein